MDCEELRSLCEHPNSRRSRNHIATLINTAASFFTGDAQDGYAFVLESKYRQPLLQAAHSSSQPSSLPSDQTLSLMLDAHLTSRQFKTITKQATHKWVEDEDGAGHYELQQAWTRWASYYETSSMYHDMDLGKVCVCIFIHRFLPLPFVAAPISSFCFPCFTCLNIIPFSCY